MGDTYFERLFTWYTQMHLVKWCVLNYCKVYVVLKTILARLFAVRYLYLLLTRRKTDFTSPVCRLKIMVWSNILPSVTSFQSSRRSNILRFHWFLRSIPAVAYCMSATDFVVHVLHTNAPREVVHVELLLSVRREKQSWLLCRCDSSNGTKTALTRLLSWYNYMWYVGHF